jgi:hypothetical protein
LPDGEGDYYVRRFGDPTFIVADGIARAVARVVGPSSAGRRFVDVCSGCGHLARTLDTLRSHDAPPVMALDASFWRLQVMRRFIAPDADAICMDANLALPLASHSASLAICNDAFSYVWSKRALSADMQRLVHPQGAVVLTHVHSMYGRTHGRQRWRLGVSPCSPPGTCSTTRGYATNACGPKCRSRDTADVDVGPALSRSSRRTTRLRRARPADPGAGCSCQSATS